MIVEPAEETFLAPSNSRPPRRGRAVLFGGVAAACVLGVGMGLWARPAMHERRAAAVPIQEAIAAPTATTRRLQIVVADRPGPASAAVRAPVAAQILPPPAPAIEPVAPVGPPEGLIRAHAVSPPAAPPQPLFPPGAMKTVFPAIGSAIAATGMAIARAEAPPQHLSASHPAPQKLAEAAAPKPALQPRRTDAHATEAHLLKAPAVKADAARIQNARAEIAKARAARVQLAKAHAARIHLARAEAKEAEAAQVQARAAAHRLQLAQAARAKEAARAQKAEQIRLAQAEARGRQEAREEARQEALADAHKRARLAALAHAFARALPHRAPPPQPQPVELAKLDRHRGHKLGHPVRVEQASLKRHGREAPRFAAAHPTRMRPEPVAPQPASGLMRVSTTPRCANRDPGEAVVCADPSLGAADRQMARAYQVARAAGVPDAQLRSQQQHWLAARSSAAREAPWAVRDVYMARIAELNGQAKDAQDGY